MRKFLLALPLASFLALAGCTTDDGFDSAAATLSSPSSDTAAAATVTQAPAPAQQQPVMPARRSTTQPLPAGYGYLNEKELGAQTPIRPAAAAPAAAKPAAAAPTPASAATPARNG